MGYEPTVTPGLQDVSAAMTLCLLGTHLDRTADYLDTDERCVQTRPPRRSGHPL